MSVENGVLVIYTGGTIGSKPRDPDPDSPQVVVPWHEVLERTVELGRVGYRVDAYEEIEPLDSCNVAPEQWVAMAECIRDRYDDYNGFVILHGTDTMVYTACALSFMLRELGKPVILTGSQRSALVSDRNDATQNVLTALAIANPEASNLPTVPEVCIYFGGVLLRGNRAMKVDTVGYTAYTTSNIPPLGTAGDRIVINERLIRPLPAAGRKFNIRTRLDTHVLPLYIMPGIQNTQIAQSQLTTKDLRAAVVLSFGSGNIPTAPDFLEAFRGARAKDNVILANVSQCPTGPVELGLYETSAALLEAGFISAADITVEAAQCKLMALLGDPDATIEDVEFNFQLNLAGELSVSQYVTKYPASGKVSLLDETCPRHRTRGVTIASGFTAGGAERAILRLQRAKVSSAPDAVEPIPPVALRVFLNLDDDAQADETVPGFAGHYRKWPTDSQGVVMFDITNAFRATAESGDRLSFTIFIDTPGQLSWEGAELAVFVRESDI